MQYDNAGKGDGVRPTSPKPGFVSFKNALPIRYLRRWHRDMLIQLALDPAVIVMEPSRIVDDRSDFRVTVRTTASVLDLVAVECTEEASEPPPDGWIAIPRSKVVRQPRIGTARMVWAARGRPIPAGDRLEILTAIDSRVEGVTVGSLLAASRRSPAEQAEAVFALACEGLVAIDLARPFSPSTRVRSTAIIERTSKSGLAVLL